MCGDKRKKNQLCLSYFKVDQKICEFINNVDSVEEESLTDYLLWKMKEVNKRIRHANLRKFKKKEESNISGADFEMEVWLVSKNKGIPLVIQAKKAVDKYDGYCNKLNYKPSNKNKRQLDTLIEYCQNNKKLPFYLFYTSCIDKNIDPYSWSYKCGGYRWSIYETCLVLVDAISIKFIADNCKGSNLHKKEFLSKGNPFCCLFCCPFSYRNNYSNNSNTPSLSGIVAYLNRYYPRISREYRISREHKVIREVPKYVQLLTEQRKLTPEIFKEYSKELRRFNHLVVIPLED